MQLDHDDMKLIKIESEPEVIDGENVITCDVTLSGKFRNDFLARLHPKLKSSLYDRPEVPDLVEDAEHRPHLRFPELPVLKWKSDLSGALFTIHAAVTGEEHQFTCDLKKNITLKFAADSTFEVEFVIKIILRGDHEDEILRQYLGQQPKVSLQPPVNAEPELEGMAA